MRKFWGYLNHCNLKLAVDLNPFVWGFRYLHQGPDPQADPDLHIWYIRCLPLSIILTIDSGRYIMEGEAIDVVGDMYEEDSQAIVPDHL